jgi:Tol biopolymer transport system component
MRKFDCKPILRRAAAVLALIFMIGTINAQDASLIGPLLATTNAAQDSILLIETESGWIRAFSVGDGLHTVWDFSPDGCQMLVTLTGVDGLPRLYVTSLTGEIVSEPVQYNELASGQWGAWEPDWSPDGSKIAFRMMRDGFEGEEERQYHIGWVTPEGSEPEFYSVSGREHSPRWSPDGMWLAYVSYDKRAPGADARSTAEPTAEALIDPEDYIQEADLWVVATDASVKYRLTAYETGSVSRPRWSPDGATIGYVYSPSPSNDTYWTVANQQHARPTQITYGYSLSLDLTWTPENELLASARSFGGQESHGLWRIPMKAGADADVSAFFDMATLPYPDYPAFNADATTLALRSGYRGALVDLVNGGARFIAGADGNMPLIWTPGAFTSEESCVDAF